MGDCAFGGAAYESCGDSPDADMQSLSKKTAALSGRFPGRPEKAYFGGVVAPPVLPEVPPAAGEPTEAVSRVPRTSISTRRSGCRQEISFEPLTPLHWSPVTGWLSPRPCACTRCCSTPFCARYCLTASARSAESFSLYCSGPMRSAWPTARTDSTCASLMRSASWSSSSRPAGRSSALSNSNSTSDCSVTFSITGAGATGAAAIGAGGTATTTGAGAVTTCTASHGATALPGLQSVVFQHCPNGDIHTWLRESDT